MSYLKKVLNKYYNSGLVVSFNLTKGFIDEVEKDIPNVIIWKNNLNLINICSSDEYCNVIKESLYKRLETGTKNTPEILYVVDDKETALKIYDAISISDYGEKLESIIDALNNQPLVLSL